MTWTRSNAVVLRRISQDQRALLKGHRHVPAHQLILTTNSAGEASSASNLMASLGPMWSHAVNTRIIMESASDMRYIKVAYFVKHPTSSDCKETYQSCTHGVCPGGGLRLMRALTVAGCQVPDGAQLGFCIQDHGGRHRVAGGASAYSNSDREPHAAAYSA